MKPSYVSTLSAIVASLVMSFSAMAQTKPLDPAKDFMIFAESSITVFGGDCGGPIATGGNIIVNGPFAVASNYAGTYRVSGDANNIGLFAAGSISGTNQVQVLGNTIIKIGNTAGTNCNQSGNILEVSNGNVLAKSSVSQTCAQVSTLGDLNFSAAFSNLRINAACMSSKADNTTLAGDANNGILNCVNAVNYITLTTAQLNSSMNLSANPDAAHVLIINVNGGAAAFNWSGGFKLQNNSSSYTLINFYNTPTINFNNAGADVHATVFAPNSDFNKNTPVNIEGQVVCKNYLHTSGEVHMSPFLGMITCSSAGPLPLTFTKLDGTVNKNTVQLGWGTLSEQNLDYFIVTASYDGATFFPKGKVYAAGTSNGNLRSYSYIDKTPLAGANFYRLTLVDKDGKEMFSNIVSVNIAVKGITVNAVYPNPFTDKIIMNIAAENNQEITLQLCDNVGKLVSTQQTTIQKGISKVTFGGLDSFSKGMYILKLKTYSGTTTLKLVK